MKPPNFSWKYALIIIGLVVLASLGVDFNRRMMRLRQLSEQRDRVAARLEGLQSTQAYLETQIAYATSEAAVVRWAYEEGKMVRPGDNPVVPLPPAASTPVPTPTPVATVESIRNWQVWLWLFVDTKPSDRGP
jgi:hypothetical protein